MKKRVFCALAMACMLVAFSSCEKKMACFEIKVTAGPLSETTYVYTTEDQAQTMSTTMRSAYMAEGESVTVTVKKVDKSETDCTAQVSFD